MMKLLIVLCLLPACLAFGISGITCPSGVQTNTTVSDFYPERKSCPPYVTSCQKLRYEIVKGETRSVVVAYECDSENRCSHLKINENCTDIMPESNEILVGSVQKITICCSKSGIFPDGQ